MLVRAEIIKLPAPTKPQDAHTPTQQNNITAKPQNNMRDAYDTWMFQMLHLVRNLRETLKEQPERDTNGNFPLNEMANVCLAEDHPEHITLKMHAYGNPQDIHAEITIHKKKPKKYDYYGEYV